MRTVLIDADSLVYQAARANEVETQWDDDLWTLHANFDPAAERLDRDVETIKAQLDADRVVMALSDYTAPWRKRIMPTYKHNRKDVRKPVIFRPLREYIHEVYETWQRPGLEGDDVLGILATNPVVIEGEKIIVSLDKDMNTLPGQFVNLKYAMERDDWTVKQVSLAEADCYHMTQTLSGDTTDGYPGCPGIGKVRAERMLADFCLGDGTFDNAGAWQAIVAAYVKAGQGDAEALLNARVSRILRHGDYDYTSKEVRLWTPPTI